MLLFSILELQYLRGTHWIRDLVSRIAACGAKTISVLKAAASADKFCVVSHSLIASAEKTSLPNVKTTFYQIIRKRVSSRLELYRGQVLENCLCTKTI